MPLNVKNETAYSGMGNYSTDKLVKGLATIESGFGYHNAGALLSLDAGVYKALDPSDADLKYAFGVLLEKADARTSAVSALVGVRGVFNLEFVYIPYYDEFAGDGTATEFTLSHRPQEGTVNVFVNGVKQAEGIDYTVDYLESKIVFSTAPDAGAEIKVWYGSGVRHYRFNTQGFSAGEAIKKGSLALYDETRLMAETEYTVDYTTGDITLNEAPSDYIDVYYITPDYELVLRNAEGQEIYVVNLRR